ncbi:hypothetical protein HG530_000972 [Fusarium avenaceum]|nr:hypothetical protein HG530_000972 [Fusarium avenaceum]
MPTEQSHQYRLILVIFMVRKEKTIGAMISTISTKRTVSVGSSKALDIGKFTWIEAHAFLIFPSKSRNAGFDFKLAQLFSYLFSFFGTSIAQLMVDNES